jgi:hypothetical protein
LGAKAGTGEFQLGRLSQRVGKISVVSFCKKQALQAKAHATLMLR